MRRYPKQNSVVERSVEKLTKLVATRLVEIEMCINSTI